MTASTAEAEVNREKQCQKAVGEKYLPSHVTSANKAQQQRKSIAPTGCIAESLGSHSGCCERQEEELRQQSLYRVIPPLVTPVQLLATTVGTF